IGNRESLKSVPHYCVRGVCGFAATSVSSTADSKLLDRTDDVFGQNASVTCRRHRRGTAAD
ncbi:hypothetical protein, partial [Xanthomonas perforans]|uniref:hypothetical protein n=1 Tax=Xanthomonas perforans TaxID=442694 RepID=UPI001C1DF0FA